MFFPRQATQRLGIIAMPEAVAAVSRERYGRAADYLRPVGLQAGRLFKVAFQLNF